MSDDDMTNGFSAPTDDESSASTPLDPELAADFAEIAALDLPMPWFFAPDGLSVDAWEVLPLVRQVRMALALGQRGYLHRTLWPMWSKLCDNAMVHAELFAELERVKVPWRLVRAGVQQYRTIIGQTAPVPAPGKPTIVQRLVQCVEEVHPLFVHGHNQRTYMVLGGIATDLASEEAENWLLVHFRKATTEVARLDAVKNALRQVQAEVQLLAPVPVYRRMGREQDGTWVVDLGDHMARLRTENWILGETSAHMLRHGGMPLLPTPTPGGSLAAWEAYIPLGVDERRLLLTWLTWSFSPTGPYPLLVLRGEQGSGKTMLSWMCKALADPGDVTSFPTSEEDLAVATLHERLLAYDNLSSLPPWASDALCRLATGGQFVTRKLYSATDQTRIYAQCPVILNGIPDLTKRPDLAQRALVLDVPTMPRGRRKSEARLYSLFARDAPMLLGTLLDTIVIGRKYWGETPPEAEDMRMADFARWGCAVARPLGWDATRFLTHYQAKQDEAEAVVMESSEVLAPLFSFMHGKTTWEGSATDLLHFLERYALDGEGAPVDVRHTPGWPKKANHLTAELRRLAPACRRRGVEVAFERTGKTGQRTVHLTTLAL